MNSSPTRRVASTLPIDRYIPLLALGKDERRGVGARTKPGLPPL
jgi:hypothetical protein